MLRASANTRFNITCNSKNSINTIENICENITKDDRISIIGHWKDKSDSSFNMDGEYFLKVAKCIGLPKEKVYRVKFYDSEECYIFEKGTKFIMRNLDEVPVEKLKEGDLCSTSKEIIPLAKIGVVKYVVEEEPTNVFYSINIPEINDNLAGITLSNGVHVVANVA